MHAHREPQIDANASERDPEVRAGFLRSMGRPSLALFVSLFFRAVCIFVPSPFCRCLVKRNAQQLGACASSWGSNRAGFGRDAVRELGLKKGMSQKCLQQTILVFSENKYFKQAFNFLWLCSQGIFSMDLILIVQLATNDYVHGQLPC